MIAPSNLKIRKAILSDLKEVHNLVIELAIYEKAEEKMVATLDEYHTAFQQGEFDCLVAELDGEVVGIALYYSTFSTWKGVILHLEDFIVKQKLRSQGIGQQLLDAFIQIGRDRKARMVKWQVIDWNHKAIKFYERNGAYIDKEWFDCKVYF